MKYTRHNNFLEFLRKKSGQKFALLPMSVEGDLEVMPPSPTQVVPMEILRPRPSVFYGEEARRTGK